VDDVERASNSSREIHYVTQTPSPLILLPIEDALARKEQPNLPGTLGTHPNWQYRLPENTLDVLQPTLQDIEASMKEMQA
jgi:4-alpha-glucanotransferase